MASGLRARLCFSMAMELLSEIHAFPACNDPITCPFPSIPDQYYIQKRAAYPGAVGPPDRKQDRNRRVRTSGDGMDRAAEKTWQERKADIRDIVDLVLSDDLMILLGLMMAPIVIIPLLVPSLPEPVAGFFNIVDTAIITIFVLEYILKLGLAQDPVSHFLDRWHLLDLLIITLPILELVPVAGSTLARSSPTLRILRLVRVAAAGGRSVERQIEPPPIISGPPAPEFSTMRIRGLLRDPGNALEELTPGKVKKHLEDPSIEAWFDISGITWMDFPVLSDLLDLPAVFFESKLMKPSHPGITSADNTRLIFLQEPEQAFRVQNRVKIPVVTHIGLIILNRGNTIVTVSKEKDRFFEQVRAGLDTSIFSGVPLCARVLYGFLDRINENYNRILSEMEAELMQLESIPHKEMPGNFLDSVFQLKRVSSILASSLFHLREVTTIITDTIPVSGSWAGQKSIFATLSDETEYLHETAGNIREGLLSLIDVHINTVSYEMNRAMRVIAVLSALVLIPTLVGQMLGMNILGIPFDLYLWEVTVSTLIAMLAIGWISYKLGWLR